MTNVKRTVKAVREALLKADFGSQDKFCDAKELKQPWFTKRMPDELVSFFSVFVNIKKTTLLKLHYNADDSEDILAEEQEPEDEKLSTKATKIKLLFQFFLQHSQRLSENSSSYNERC